MYLCQLQNLPFKKLIFYFEWEDQSEKVCCLLIHAGVIKCITVLYCIMCLIGIHIQHCYALLSMLVCMIRECLMVDTTLGYALCCINHSTSPHAVFFLTHMHALQMSYKNSLDFFPIERET